MRIGYLTDIHMRLETPEGRTDNFRNSLLLKLEECGDIFNKENCDIVLCGGDWTDRPDVSYSAFNDLAKVLKSWNLPIIGIIGSHDYYGYELKSLRRTAVGALVISGIIDLVGIGDQQFVEVKDKKNQKDIIICGTPHTYYLDFNPENYYKPLYKNGSIQIQLTHGSLLESPAPFEHVLIENVKTESHIVLGAHYHPGFKKVHNIKGTFFAHPGSIARLDNTGVRRIPKVLIIDIEDKINFNFVELKSALEHPFKDKIIKEEIPEISVDRVLELIQDVKVGIVDVKQRLYQICKELDYSDDIIEEAFNLIEQVEKQ
uniref:Calcineurin-like phosphoesterase domain-containing protein n=1 Tax=Dictyoglomus turgidum TaxID=513050 RepID=A0A7C3SQ60_9BACT